MTNDKDQDTRDLQLLEKIERAADEHPTAQDRIDTTAQCPYCEAEQHTKGENYSEEARIEECGECGMRFWQNEVFTTEYATSGDCKLNDLEHDWEPLNPEGDHPEYRHCRRCEAVWDVATIAFHAGEEGA